MPRTDEQIRRARRESGLSQEALAERIGVPPAELYRYEEGAEISPRHLGLIAVATGKPLSFFLDGTGVGSPNGRGIGGRLRAALPWLSEPAAADTDADSLFAEVATRQHALDERAADFPERADEWRAYIVFLRDFVHADGNLPATFNSLVREVFRELL